MSWGRLLTLCLGLALVGCAEPPKRTYAGYAEAETIIVAAPQGGWIERLSVSKGQVVKTGDALFTLDGEAQRAERERAAAALSQAEAQAADLRKGRRRDEIAVFEASVREAVAQQTLADAELQRARSLLARGFSTTKAVQTAQSAADAARARVANARSQLSTAKLGGREDLLAAADAQVKAARAQVAMADYAVAQREIRARNSGRIDDVLRETGEYVPAQGAVLQLLPENSMKVRFFVPQAARAQISIGQIVSILCDGCQQRISAKVTFIAATAEFTPPIIYSESAREKLVWRIEAQPLPGQKTLTAGQPVDVDTQPQPMPQS